MQPAAPQGSTPLRRISLSAVALLVVLIALISCMGGEVTAPRKADVMYAHGLRFNTIFPAAYQQSAFAGLVTFDRVRVVIRRPDGTVALDTTVNFPANVDEISLDLSVPLAGSSAEDLMVSLGYLNTANDTVFKGTKQITATPTLPGQPGQAPVTIPVVYTGPGATATAVRISPRQLTVNGGGTFAFTAVGVDASGATIATAPISWSSLDPARATITSPTAGNGVALSQRGTARILATLISGQTDTALVTVNLPPSAIAAVSGSGQVGLIGKPTVHPFAQPLVVKVSAADGGGASGVTVNFAAATGGGSVSPASAVTDTNGVAQTTWTPGNTTGTQTATASVAGLAGSPVTFTATVNQTVATKLVFTTAPVAGASLDATTAQSFVVAAQDVDGDPVSSFTGTVALSIGTGPAGATLTGTTSVAAVAGIATFSNIGIAVPGTGYAINAASAGLTNVLSPTFNVMNGAPATLALVSGGGQTAAPGAVLSPITVVVKDAAGNPTLGTTVVFAVTSGGGSITPPSTLANANGQASATWTLGSTPGAQTMTATVLGLPPVTVSATATGTGNQIAITQQPGATQLAGGNVSPALVAEVRNSAGVLLSTFSGTVTLAIGTNPGGATLSGTTTVAAANGIATFSAFSLNKAGVGYTVVASTTGATSATSTAFTVAAAAPATLTLQSGGAQSGQPNTALAAPIVVRVNDGFGNPVSGVPLQFAVSSGGGSVTPTTASTSAAGTASVAWTLGPSGTQTLTTTSSALPNQPLNTSATFGAGGPVTTVVSPQRDTITALTDTRTITAQGRDATGNLVAGTWTWVSRTPSVATVSATGVVTAIIDGSSYIVATEAGGSKDSSLIVVQQRIASVNVNPSARSIYNGAQFTFSAQAVDGRGVPMTAQPTFGWTSSVPSVATVNATTGVAAGVGLGNTQIRATAGNIVGVSNLTVLTPITRIDVTYDSANAVAPDVFTMTSLGDRRMYRAIARDTLLNVMPAVTFTWSSTNASVALIDSTTPTKARAVAAANGVTSIQATAQGVIGGATLNVAQVLNSIDLSPTSAIVAVAGSTQLIARGKDANGIFISGGSFLFSSSAPGVATVGASSGVVTGVANGTSNITAASGQITSNVAVVSVNNSGPSIISFGRDTLGIGRGTTASIPILLSKPNAAAVTVNLAVADTFAFWSTASVTVPAGQTSVNATLNGRNAGTTKIYAVDGGNTAYAGDTAVLRVQANLRMTTTSYGLNATDQLNTQALLSDPSPAGGTYVTFGYGTPGKALVSPDPAFIPAGQLAANVVIRGIAAGNTTLTPSAAGVTGTSSSINVGAATLRIPQTQIRLGEGQYDVNNEYVQVPQTLYTPLTVTLTSRDTTLSRVTPQVTISANSNTYQYFTVSGVGRGTTRIVASAPGWAADSTTVITTTPLVAVSGGGTFNTTSPATNLTVYSEDSLRSAHQRINSLVVRISSSDSNVMRVIDTIVTIGAGSYYTSALVTPGGVGGTAWIKATASGHTADSVLYTVNGPALTFAYTTSTLGVGQEETNFYIQIPNGVGTAVPVTLTSSDSNKVGVNQIVTIPANNNYAYFTLRGKSLGSATIIASAAGYRPDTATTIVTTPRLTAQGGGTLNQFATTTVQAYVRDSTQNAHNRTTPLTVSLRSTDTTVIVVDTVGTIAAGTYYLSVGALVVANGPGTARVIVTAPGHAPDSMTFTVIPAKLSLSFNTVNIGARQMADPNSFYVSLGANRSVAVPVTLTQKHANIVTLSTTTTTVPVNNTIGYFTLGGLATGKDTIIASAQGYLPDTAFVTVIPPKLRASGLPGSATTTSPPSTTTVYASDSLGGIHNTIDTVVVHVTSSDSTVLRPGQPYYRILKGAYYVNPIVQFVGVGTAKIIYTDSMGVYGADSTNNVTVTGPSLSIQGGNGQLGMRQRSSVNDMYVYTPNSVSTPLTVNLISTDPRVVGVPATVTIPANSNVAYFTATALDTIGTIQIQATATGYNAAATNLQVTQPRFGLSITNQMNTTAPPGVVTVYAMDANGTVHEVAQPVVVNLASSAPGVLAIDSAFVTIPTGQYYSQGARMTPGSVGVATVTASDSRQVFYSYQSVSSSVSVVLPSASLSFSTFALGIGQYQDEYTYVPNTLASPLTVPLGHSAVPHTNTPSSYAIPAGTNYDYFRITGTSVGSDTITASPSGYVPGKGVVVVSLGHVDPLQGWPSTLRAGDSVLVTLYARDASQGTHYVTAATTFTLAPNANVQFTSGGSQSTVITTATIAANASYIQFYLKGVTAGTGSANITATNYASYFNSLTVTP